MKTPILTLLTLLLFTFSSTLLGQKNWAPAIVIDQQGNERSGEINDDEWLAGPYTIQFRSTAEAEVEIYGPQDLRSFTVNGKKYHSATVKVIANQSKVNTTDATQKKYRTDETFILQLIGDDKKLYQYTDRNRKEHFLIGDEPNTPIPLDNYVYLDPDKSVTKRDVSYRRKIYDYLSSCPAITELAGQVTYERKAIEALFMIWYNCQSTAPATVDYRIQKSKGRFMVAPTVGLGLTLIQYVNDSPVILEQEWTSSLDPTFGLTFQYAFPGKRQASRLSLELQYQGHQATGEVITDRTANITTVDSITINRRNLNVLLGFHRRVFGNKNSFYYSGGAGVNFYSRNDILNIQIRKIDLLNFEDTRTTKFNIEPEELSISPSLYLEGGLEFQRATLGLRYQFTVNSEPNTASFDIHTHTFFILGRYYLFN